MENDLLKFNSTIIQKFNNAMLFVKIMAIVTVVTVVACIAFTFMHDAKRSQQVYVLDQGAVLSAFRADNGVQKDLEIMNQMYRFHELLYNMPPNMEMIERNAVAAMELADRSAYDYWCDLKEMQYFTRLISTNATQQIIVDSVKTDIMQYPYPVRTYATVFVIRESNITSYTMESECIVTESVRTPKNPHGLLIEKFHVSKFEQGQTRSRK